jgi:hypothetical protein
MGTAVYKTADHQYGFPQKINKTIKYTFSTKNKLNTVLVTSKSDPTMVKENIIAKRKDKYN